MKAIYLNDVGRGGCTSGILEHGKAAVYRLEPPLGDIHYVYISTATIRGEPETYAFRSDDKGEVSDWCELGGSAKGDYTHADVLGFMGYSL